jgi:hypothetical protein
VFKCMPQSRSGLVLLIALVLSVSFAVPAERVAETAYDESESMPYETSGVFFIPVPENVSELSADPAAASLSCVACLRRLVPELLDQGIGSAHPICDSLTILDHLLRC